MLQQLLHIIIISFICIIWGLPVFIFFSKKEKETQWLNNGMGTIIFLFFAGFISISLLSSWLVLLLPLRFEYLLFATLPIIIISALHFKALKTKLSTALNAQLKLSIPVLLFLLSCILLFLVLGTLRTVNIDTQLYHLQIIRWTNEYGTVPGLANLYPRFGLGSNLFNLISIFYLPFFKTQNFSYINSSVTIWFLLWLLYKWNCHNSKSENHNKQFSILYFLLLLYFLFDWQLFRDTANSTSYDFIVTVLTIMSLTFILENILQKQKKEFSHFLIIISLSIIPFKLSGIFILFPLFFYMISFRKVKSWVASIITAIILLTPLLIKNYITTGYPLFPSTLTFGTTDWMLPNDMAQQFQEYILSVNKFYNQNIGFISSYPKTTFNWIPFWWKGILVQHKILIGLSSLSIIYLFYTAFINKGPKKIMLFIISLWLMTAAWFFTAPDPRFAYGFLLITALFPIALILPKYIAFTRLYTILFLILTPILLLYTFKKSAPILSERKYFVSVISNEIPQYNIYNINGNEFKKPEKINDNWNNRCFYLPLPCICEENSFLIQRGSSIKKGFRMNPITDSNFIYNYNY